MKNTTYIRDLITSATAIINCTPHPVELRSTSGDITHIWYPEGTIPRVQISYTPIGNFPIPGFPEKAWRAVLRSITHVTGLPEPTPGTLFIVSSFVASASPHRHDLLVPIPYKVNGIPKGATGFYIDTRGFAMPSTQGVHDDNS